VCRSYIHAVMDEVSTNGRYILEGKTCYGNQVMGDNSILPIKRASRR